MDHISHDAMRAYLLGLLSDDQAAILEEQYFVNRAIFLQVQSEEAALISDYIEGRLRGREKQSFELRYLQAPHLRSKVEEIRKRSEAALPVIRQSLWTSPRLAFAAILALIMGLGIWIYYSRLNDQTKSDAHNREPVSVPASQGREFAVYLTPGITKGAGSVGAHFPQPQIQDTIRLILELPGEAARVQRTVQVFRIKPDGTLDKIWKIPDPMLSTLSHRGAGLISTTPTFQALSLQLPGSLLLPGDYLIKTSTTDGRIHETYEYRVTARP